MTPSMNDFHDRFLAEQLRDPIFRDEYDRCKRHIEAIDAAVNASELDARHLVSSDQASIGGTRDP